LNYTSVDDFISKTITWLNSEKLTKVDIN